MKTLAPEDRWIIEKPIAHRGLHTEREPENSMPAFLSAVRHGYAIELDVQLSKDGEIIVFHDYSLKRMTGLNQDVAALTLAELKALRLKNSQAQIPTMRETLEKVGGRTPILIEIKNDGRPGELEKKLCDMLSDYQGAFAVQSFNPLSLGAVKKRCPHFLRGQLSSQYKGDSMSFLKKLCLQKMILNFISQPRFIAYKVKDLPVKEVSFLRKHGMPVLGWTVKSQELLEKAELYCDNVIFENILVKN